MVYVLQKYLVTIITFIYLLLTKQEAEILIKNRIFDILVTSPQVTKHKIKVKIYNYEFIYNFIKRVINCLEKDPNV